MKTPLVNQTAWFSLHFFPSPYPQKTQHPSIQPHNDILHPPHLRRPPPPLAHLRTLPSSLPPRPLFPKLTPGAPKQISLISLLNTFQSYLTTSYTARVYSLARNPAPSALQARTFGTWTLLAAIVRLYVAYHVRERGMYELGMWTFAVAGAHFGAEWGGYGSVAWGKGLAGPVVVSLGSLGWMGWQWGGYLG